MSPYSHENGSIETTTSFCEDSIMPVNSSSSSSSSKSKADEMSKAAANPSQVDKFVVEELQKMSSLDRGIVQEEIHGVSSCAVVEDEQQIKEGLKNLEEEIRTIRKEVLFKSSTTNESEDGNKYNEDIWSYIALPEDVGDQAEAEKTRILYSYIFHHDFRLKFLRADFYNAKKAAHRYLRCLEGLLKYFGAYALQRPLMYADLGREAQSAARAGYVQILPSRDRAGRLVVVSQETIGSNSKATDQLSVILRLLTYMYSVVAEDIETQRRGVVLIFSTDEEALQVINDPKDREEFRLYREGSPVRRSCTHFCLPENDPKMRILRAIMMVAMAREERVRTRIHMDGLTVETRNKLMTFGIAVPELPITSTGAIKTKHHLQWIKSRKAIDLGRMKALEECFRNETPPAQQGRNANGDEDEHSSAPSDNDKSSQQQQHCCMHPTYEQYLKLKIKEPITHPMTNDVLFGKGGNVKNVTHYGTLEFTDLMKHSLMQYVSGVPLKNRIKRESIRQAIIDEVQSRGGRFLSLDKKFSGGCCWTEIVSGPDLHDRVATSLYDHKRRLTTKLKAHRRSTAMIPEIIHANSDHSSIKRRKVITDDGELISVGSSFCGGVVGNNNRAFVAF